MLPNLVTQVETIHRRYSHYPARNDEHNQDVSKSNHIIITKYCQYNPSLHMVFKNRVKLYTRKGMMHLE